MRFADKVAAGDTCVGLTLRRSIRLRGYDYTNAGAYFVTLRTGDPKFLFGRVVGGAMQLDEWGKIVEACWDAKPEHFPAVQPDTSVVMQNHLLGILIIHDVGATHASPTPRTSRMTGPD